MTKIASSGSPEALTKAINDYHYSTTFKIVDGKVYNKNGLFEAGIVKKKGNRYTYYITK